jgi:hypothetical protein
MEERGATLEEVRRTMESGHVVSAKFGRQIYAMTVPYGDFWGSRFFAQKEIEVCCVEEDEDIIVITVVVKYF